MHISEKLSSGILSFVKSAIWTLPLRQKARILKIMSIQRKAASKRKKRIKGGAISSPPYLIYSVTNQCNLNCVGCYAQKSVHTESCLLSTDEARDLLKNAVDMGIGTVIIAGGEPLMRPDLFDLMAERRDILFLLFTNGTLLNNNHIARLRKMPHVIPVISIEGDQKQTDERRGDGVATTVKAAMARLKAQKLLYGISVTVNKDNLKDTLDPAWIVKVKDDGCSVIFYIEYVPVDQKTKSKVLDESDRTFLIKSVDSLRKRSGILAVTFPGDEKELGGCLAAGRGFVHVSGSGAVEPCPFSPYSTHNVKDGLQKVIDSPFFQALREHGHLMEEPDGGGCALFARRDEVEALIQSCKEK